MVCYLKHNIYIGIFLIFLGLHTQYIPVFNNCFCLAILQFSLNYWQRILCIRHFAWWVAWLVWSSGGDCTLTWRGPRSYHHSPTCTSSRSASSPCGRTQLMLMAGNGWVHVIIVYNNPLCLQAVTWEVFQ